MSGYSAVFISFPGKAFYRVSLKPVRICTRREFIFLVEGIICNLRLPLVFFFYNYVPFSLLQCCRESNEFADHKFRPLVFTAFLHLVSVVHRISGIKL